MSQKVPEQSNPKNAPTSEQKQPVPPIGGVSPDDPIEVKVVGPGPTSAEK